ncbi:MAG TPA: hypothetical protein VMT24_15285 [Aggregatilineaceae bacterium]|nr:hypothetical protein [Aggregatilineaceae bacterium]
MSFWNRAWVSDALGLKTGRVAAALSRWWHDPAIRIPVVVFLAARLFTLVVGSVGGNISSIHNPYADDRIFVASLEVTHADGRLYDLIGGWHRWDTGWYMKIAAKGYSGDDGSIIFAPLYPASMAALNVVVGDMLLSGLLVSSAACLVTLLLLYRLARYETGSDSAAQTALVALIGFPTAFYLLAAYTESLFLAFTMGTLLAARRSRWGLVVVLAAGATLTRLQGWILFFPLGWLAFFERPRFWQAGDSSRSARLGQAAVRLTAAGVGPLMVVLFMGYLRLAHLGSIDRAYEQFWALWVRPPWAVVVDVIRRMVQGEANFIEYTGFAALMIIVALCLLSIWRLPVMYHLYLWPTLGFILLRYYPQYLLNGTMRYVLDFFPIFITAGMLLATRPCWRLAWVGAGLFLQMWLLFLFAQWMWIA